MKLSNVPLKSWPVPDRKEGKRENYKQSTGENFRNGEWIRDTKGINRPTASVPLTKLDPHSRDVRVKRWRYVWVCSKDDQRGTWKNSWKIRFRLNA